MRPSVVALAFVLSVSPSVKAQTAASSQTLPPQTARQALIEMVFGTSATHLEKHLPDVTRRTVKRMGSGNGQSFLSDFSSLASQAKAGGAKFETFDVGPTLLTLDQPGIGDGRGVEGEK